MTDKQIYVLFLVVALWSIAWMIVGLLAGERLQKPHLGALLGVFFGPMILFAFLIPDGRKHV